MRSRVVALVVSSLLVWACDRPHATGEGAGASGARAVGSAASSAVVAVAVPSAAASVTNAPNGGFLPRAYRNRGLSAVAQNAACVRCHANEARQHQGSGHQRATVNPAFRAALSIEPTPFCRGCHAPEADPKHDTPVAMRDLGVGCVTCHTDDAGNVFAVPRAGRPAEEAAGGHTIIRSAAFAGPSACAGCHEFRFETRRGDTDEAHMQTTVREHARGPFADTSCAGCHMPLDAGGKRDHWFKGVRDPAFLRASLAASAEPLDVPGVRLTLTQALPGHAFPTGDLFRRLEVGVALHDTRGRVIVQEVRHLARHLVTAPREAGRKLVADDRVFAEPRVIDLAVTPPGDGAAIGALSLSWWVTYQRPATVGDGIDPRHAKIESSVPLHRGTIAWAPGARESAAR